MARQSKEYRSVCIKMDKQIADKLDDYVAQTRTTKTGTLECAVLAYLQSCEAAGTYVPSVQDVP